MRRRVVNCVASVAVLLAVSGCGTTAPKARADRKPEKPQPPHTPVVMFLGDSYTVGKIGQIPEQTYAADTARTLGWQVILGGFRGTGFVAKGHVGKDFSMLFDEQLSWRPAPDLVIVSGGHNDRLHSPAVVSEAARRLLTEIQQRWPKTRVLLMGPMWGGDPIPSVTSIADSLRVVAQERRIPYIDPLRERWITGDRSEGTGNAPRYILSDETHPTPEGAYYIAGLLVADLRRLKLSKP